MTRGNLVAVVGILGTGTLAAALGWLTPQRPILGLTAAALVLLVGISAWRSVVLPLAALPSLYVVQRIDVGGFDVSMSDVALAIATLTSLVFARRPFSRELRSLLWLAAVYQIATLFTVLANPYTENVVEWLHAGTLVAGGLLIGWTIGREGRGAIGLKLMLIAALVLAAWIIGAGLRQAATGDFKPVYLPYGMHKNFLGTVLGITALIAYVRPPWLHLGARAGMAIFWSLAVGIGFTQSRQAIVALSVALVLLVLRTRTDRSRSKLILLVIVPALIVVLTLVRDQLSSGDDHNSVFQRLTWFEDAVQIWQTQPLVGVGLRWWYTDRFPGGFQPPNAELEVLTSAGIVGLAGFLTLMIGSVAVLWRVTPVFGTLAVLAVLSRFVQGQLDLFWVAAQTSIPFVIAGICLGAQALHESTTATKDVFDDSVAEPARPSPKALLL